ncbi:DNA polymerase III subunit gamma/tau [Candidatus Saccharibacteria bacterium]|nr:DNA polymerase III subunit gamma/tau [Candidatus Saccharibacteria bacterium]
MGKALYRKYRPTKLEDVIGQDQVTNTLQGIIKKGNISHSYLFCGPRGTGKTTIARIFAHAINNFDYELEDDYVDIVEIDAASNRGIDNIRELRENAIVAPTKGKYKVYILDESHMLTKEASNALLKILEEPPAHIVFIMATTDPQKVLPTILSRSQVYTFRLASPEIMKDHLKKIAKQEKINIDDDALDIIVKRGGGSFRDSISLLDQISNLSDKTITADSINKALGLPQDKIIDDLLSAYTSADVARITTLLKDVLNTGSKPETIAEETINKIIATPKKELLPLLSKLPEVKAPFPEAKLLLAFLASNTDLGGSTTSLLTAFPPARTTTYIPDGPDRSAQRAVLPASQRMTSSAESGAVKSEGVESPKATDTATQPIQDASNFSWETFMASLSKSSALLYNLLQRSHHKEDATTLHLYVKNQGIFNATNNKTLLAKLSGLSIAVHDLSEYNSKDFGQISDIMGNVEEVNNDGNPFN